MVWSWIEDDKESEVGMEWLTDKEKRILLSALTREKKVCIEVDKQCSPREAYEVSLKSICESLEYKLYHDGLFKAMESRYNPNCLIR